MQRHLRMRGVADRKCSVRSTLLAMPLGPATAVLAVSATAARLGVIVPLIPWWYLTLDFIQQHIPDGRLTERKRSMLIKERRQTPPPAPFDANKSCDPVGNVFFVKTHKTGSTTLQSIINRYGYLRNLSFAFRRQDPSGHVSYREFSVASPKKMFLPPIHDMTTCTYRGYNMSTVHIAFNRNIATSYMTDGVRFISLLRDPLQQWLSAFQFFRLKTLSREHSMDALLNKKNGYWKKSLYSRNVQSLDLGLKVKQFEDDKAITQHILRLEKELDLVLITEYFDESLILLKREFCWSFEDILYVSKNIRAEPLTVSKQTEEKIRQFNSADMVLYNYYKSILLKRMENYGKSFEDDLRKFRKMNELVQQECDKSEVDLTGYGTFEYIPPVSAEEFCLLLVSESLFPQIRERQSHDKC